MSSSITLHIRQVNVSSVNVVSSAERFARVPRSIGPRIGTTLRHRQRKSRYCRPRLSRLQSLDSGSLFLHKTSGFFLFTATVLLFEVDTLLERKAYVWDFHVFLRCYFQRRYRAPRAPVDPEDVIRSLVSHVRTPGRVRFGALLRRTTPFTVERFVGALNRTRVEGVDSWGSCCQPSFL